MHSIHPGDTYHFLVAECQECTQSAAICPNREEDNSFCFCGLLAGTEICGSGTLFPKIPWNHKIESFSLA